MLASLEAGGIITLAFYNEKKHALHLFINSCVHVTAEMVLETDTNYLRFTHIYATSRLQKKHFKNYPLSKQERKDNCRISKKRIFC